MDKQTANNDVGNTDRVVAMAWHDRTSFEAIGRETGLSEDEVIVLMRRALSRRGFINWRQRVRGRITKHGKRLKRHLDPGPLPGIDQT